MTKNRFSGLKLILIIVLAFGVSVVGIGLFGRVSGEEFSPNRFARRRFSYYQLPFVAKQLTPVSFSKGVGGPPPLATYLRANGFLKSVRTKTARWDIVTINEPGRVNNKGDAEILTKYLDQPGAFGGESWLDWTKSSEHAEIAATFWPFVADLAYEELYILLPDIFDMARRSSSIKEFLTAIHKEVPTAIRKIAESEKARGNQTRAAQLDTYATRVAKLEAVPYEAPKKDEAEDETTEATDVEAESDPQDL